MLSFIVTYAAFDIVVMVTTVIYFIAYCKLNKIPAKETEEIFDEVNTRLEISLSEIYSNLSAFCRACFYVMNLILIPITSIYVYTKVLNKMDNYVAADKKTES